jgi:hypothetical protein
VEPFSARASVMAPAVLLISVAYQFRLASPPVAMSLDSCWEFVVEERLLSVN